MVRSLDPVHCLDHVPHFVLFVNACSATFAGSFLFSFEGSSSCGSPILDLGACSTGHVVAVEVESILGKNKREKPQARLHSKSACNAKYG